MALRLSTGLKNLLVGASGIKEALDGGCLAIYTGSQPTTADDTETGDLICTVAGTSGTGHLTFGTAASGSIGKDADTWSGTSGTSGTWPKVAGWFRFYAANKVTGADTAGTSVRFDGLIGTLTGELRISNTSISSSAPVIVDSVTITAKTS